MAGVKQKILIIEDDKYLVKLISETFRRRGFDVVLALDADEAYDKAIMDKPNLILLDVLLPGQNGFICLNNLKSNKKTANIPIIILSNLGQQEEIRKGLE